MRLIKWLRLTWWQRTRFTAFAVAGLGFVLMFLLTIILAGLADTNAIIRLQFLAFTMFPLLSVILIATIVRLQRQINLRSGNIKPARQHDSDKTV